MEKNQARPKAKKKNIETGIIMGQNTNVFSQLSATFLQTKGSTTEQEETFLKNTQIIQYHDQNINRLIALLRKKAEVTKIKAVLELHQQINKMEAEQIEQFISTFAQLYLEIVLNQPSKQITEEFASIAVDLLTAHKKIVISEISTLYPPLLLTHKLPKLASLLFTGKEQELGFKAVALLLKRQVRKKFVVMVRVVMDCQGKEKVIQAQFQRNCQALAKVLRELMRIFQKSQKLQQQEVEFGQWLKQTCESFGQDCVEEYFRVGGRAKASILQFYSALVAAAAKRPQWKITWQSYSKTIGLNFLDKDPLVQQSLWKGSLLLWLQSLLKLQTAEMKQKEENHLLNTFLPKSDQKLLLALKVGGFALYKQLPRFCQIFPHAVFMQHDSHKQLVNKITFCRKLLTGLLGQQDENEARMQCYADLSKLLVERARGIVLPGDQKKAKQIQSLIGKLQRECIQSLQERYYKDPPSSKNSFSYYIPQHFTALINTLQPVFQLKFNPELTYSLYHGLTVTPHNQPLIDSIFQSSKKSLTLTLKFLESFPRRDIQLDMTETNPEAEVTAKIFLLTSALPIQQNWLNHNWDIKKQVIIFDPRITQRDLDAEENDQGSHSLYFRPVLKNIPPLYDRAELDATRFQYFKKCLKDSQFSQLIKYLLPFTTDYLIPRNKSFVDQLLQWFVELSKIAEEGKWVVGAHEVLIIRVLSQLISEAFIRERSFKSFNKQLSQGFLQGYCQFVRLLFTYKMQIETQDLLRRAQSLLVVQETQIHLFNSCKKAITIAARALLSGGGEGAEKIRKNRIKKCLDLITKLLWSCLPRTGSTVTLQLTTDFLSEEKHWKDALTRSEPWHIAHLLLNSIPPESLQKVTKFCIENWKQNIVLLTLLLSVDYLLPLQALPDIRRLFVNLKGLLYRQILNLEEGQLSQLFSSVMEHIMKSQTLVLAQGMKGFIVFALLQLEENSASFLSQLTLPVLVTPFEKFIKTDSNTNHSLIFASVLSAVPLKRIEQAEQICCELTSRLLKSQGLQFLVLLSDCCLFWNKGVGAAQATINDSALLKTVLTRALLFSKNSLNTSTTNFATYTVFSLVNVGVGLAGKSVLVGHEPAIEQLFWQKVERGSQLQALTQSVKMRYASRAVLQADQQALTLLVKGLPEVIREQLSLYKEMLLSLQGQQEFHRYENVTSLFVEGAEFLLRASAFVDKQRLPNESTLLQLVLCSFAALKKAAFLLLRAMYERKLVLAVPPVFMLKSLKLQLSGDELSSEFCSLASGYFYLWQLLLRRRDATQRQSGEEETATLEQVIQGEGLGQLLIRNCLFVIQDLLGYVKNETDYPLQPEQLLLQDSQEDFLEDGEPQQRMFRLAVRTLFLFVNNFPIFLRDFIDKAKKYKNVCERLLRNVISEAIFREQVARIEVMQPEWKAGGNFQIYVTPKNKQIYAEYTHDIIRIGLRLVMRGTYPLTPVAIEFGEGLKMQDGSRWGLMLQSQLHNRNNTLISGILIWKENIDKKLSGVQECSICFDIVNPNGQLPRKACKTCKKKFHGNCIMKWFTKSNKSECPLCKSQFL